MAKRAFGGYSTDHNDVRLCQQASAGPTGVTQQATAGTNSDTPPSGSGYWTRIEGGNNFEGSTSADYDPLGTGVNEVALGYVVQYAFLIDATLSSGQSGRIFNWDVREPDHSGAVSMILEWVYVSSTTFNLQLTYGAGRTLIGSKGSTAYNTQEPISWRVELDGTNVTLWAVENGVVSSAGGSEVTAAETRLIYTRSCDMMAQDDIGAGEYISHDTCALIEADSKFDRPDSDIIGPRANANGEGSDQGWGTTAAGGGECDAGATGAVYTQVLLTGGDALSTTAYWCENATEGDLQGAQCANVTLTKDWVGVIGVVGCQANLASKTVKTLINVSVDDGTTWWDDGSGAEVGFEMLDITWDADWRKNQGFFTRSISDRVHIGEDWENLVQADADALEFRIKGDSGNGANPRMAGAFLVLLQVSADREGSPAGVLQSTMY